MKNLEIKQNELSIVPVPEVLVDPDYHLLALQLTFAIIIHVN